MRRFCALAVVCLVASPLVSPLLAEPPMEGKEVRAAVERALPLLEKGAAGHMEKRTCFACHNQGVPILALTTAQPRGFKVDKDHLQKQLQFTVDFLDRNRENYLKGRGQGGQVATAGYALLALEVGGWKPDQTTAAVAEYLLQYNNNIDHWLIRANRPPSEASDFTANYLALRALKKFGTSEQKERIAARTEEVRKWLVKTPARDTEDRVFRLWALQEAGVEKKDLTTAVKELIKTQREDGGWSQRDGMESDAYATGSVLVALHQAGGLATTDSVYQRGLQLLIKTQREDGTWYLKSRSKPFQLYYESGFPYGKDQFIAIAATGWATMALALACP